VLLMKTFLPTLKATLFFKCAPTASTHGSGAAGARAKRIATGPTQHELAPTHNAHDGVIGRDARSDDRAPERHPRCLTTLECFRPRRCRSARRSSCRWCHNRKPSSRKSSDAAVCRQAITPKVRVPWRDDAQSVVDSALQTAQEHNRRFRRKQQTPSSSETAQSSRTPRARDTSRRTAFPSRRFRSRSRATAALSRAFAMTGNTNPFSAKFSSSHQFRGMTQCVVPQRKDCSDRITQLQLRAAPRTRVRCV